MDLPVPETVTSPTVTSLPVRMASMTAPASSVVPIDAPYCAAMPVARAGVLLRVSAVGAVSLTLGGWGWLSQVEASNAAQLAQDAATKLTLADTSAASVPIANRALAPSVKAPAVVTPTATPDPTPAPEANAASAATTQTVKLDIVQWVTTNAGDPVAIVRDTRGVLWYVWGDDVPRIEQGQTPQYQPQPVNARGRSRHS